MDLSDRPAGACSKGHGDLPLVRVYDSTRHGSLCGDDAGIHMESAFRRGGYLEGADIYTKIRSCLPGKGRLFVGVIVNSENGEWERSVPI